MQNRQIDTAALRQYYLQQLGVTVYVPRGVSTGAEVDMTVAEAEPMPAVELAGSSRSNQESRTDNRRSLLTELDEGHVAANASLAVPTTGSDNRSVAQPPAYLQPAASFQMLFCMAEPNLALALQIPALARPMLQVAEAKLLQNILRWLGVRLPQDATYLHFRWPLPGLQAGDELLAGRSLAVFLQQAAAPQTLQRLLLLGLVPAHCLALAGQELDLSFNYWATHSLSEMLAMPALKRDVWQQLLPLHTAL